MLVRKFEETDQLFVIELAKRFNNIEHLAFRNEQEMGKKQEELVVQAVISNKENIFIAESGGDKLGYIELRIQDDYFTNRKQAYVSAIAVSEKSEGKGIAKILMNHAEEWAINQGLTQVSLDVFLKNKKAIDVYEHLGFQKEIVKMVKSL
ncbi:GNAT family N-acetyltransferase [Alkalicoccobacillus gibsonii]|uniref:GNAT family N-acetyltransferase n=1 Tax=Alkalicoccobacillus gibsonii TaxID=79881 RepID=UPI0019327C1F|nr:GNAT family N-acetyltransferase [Alkalicoccobacillus gibsonii]MBM0066398.1 GNAT family N-acetyltransferase [Alkalicoccobacillus gibsonii]